MRSWLHMEAREKVLRHRNGNFRNASSGPEITNSSLDLPFRPSRRRVPERRHDRVRHSNQIQFLVPSAEFLKHDNVSSGNMLNIKGTGSGVFELRIDRRARTVFISA